MDLPDCPPGAEGYEDTVTEVPKKPADSDCTKAELEFQEHLASLKIKLDDGSVRSMVERKDRDSSGKWIYLCYPCAAVCSGESILQTHISGKKHKAKLGSANVWPLNIFTDHPYYHQQTPKPGPEKKQPEKPTHVEDLPMKHINDLDKMFSKYKGLTCHIQEALDAIKAPLVGLEYLIEHPPEEDNHERKYVCTLCFKQGHPRTIVNHMTCFWHRYNYSSRHFPKANSRLIPYRSHGKYREGVAIVTNRLVQRIEDTYGRMKPINIDKEIYDRNKDRIHQWIYKGPHFTEKEGCTFEEVMDVGLIESLANGDSKNKANKRNDPSPPNVAAPVRPQFNNFSRPPGRQERRAGSIESLSDISDDLEAELRRDAAKNDDRYRDRLDDRRKATTAFRSRYSLVNNATTRKEPQSQEKTRAPNYEYKVKLAAEKREAAEEFARKTLAYHEKNPEKHPLYPEEWKKFWNKRYKEIQAEGKDPSKHDFKPEWIVFWTARMKDLHDQELRVTVNEIYRKFCLTPPDMSKKSPEPSRSSEALRRPSDLRRRSPPEKRRRSPELHRPDARRRSPDSRRRSPEPRRHSPVQRRRSPDPPHRLPDRRRHTPDLHRRHPPDLHRRSPEPHRRSPSLRHRSPLRRKSPDIKRDCRSPNVRPSPVKRRSTDRNRSPLHRTRSRSPLQRASGQRTRIALDSIRRSRSPLSQREMQPRNRSPELAPSLQTVLISDEELKDDGLSPWNSDNDIGSIDSGGGRSHAESLTSRASRARPRSQHTTVSESTAPDDVIGTLRLLVALEDYLGSLGPKLIDLLAEALKMEKEKANSAEELLVRESAVVLIETAKEKLKGAVQAGLISGSAATAARSAVVRAAAMLHEADKRAKMTKTVTQSKLSSTSSKQSAVPVAGVGEVDRAQIAQQMAEALIAQGKTDVSSEELAQLVDAVVGMAEAKKREAEKRQPETVSTSLHNQPASSLPKSKGAASALQMLQSAYDENDKKVEKEDAPDVMDGLSDSDLETLLKNFNELSAEEQHSLIAYLKKLEAREPLRVERLRQYVSDAAHVPGPAVADLKSPAPAPPLASVPGPNPTAAPVASQFEQVVLESDDDDYTVEEVFQSATQKVKEDQIRQEMEIVKKSLEETKSLEPSQFTTCIIPEMTAGLKAAVQNVSSASDLLALVQASIKSTTTATAIPIAQPLEVIASNTQPRSFGDLPEPAIAPQDSTKSNPAPLLSMFSSTSVSNQPAPLLSTPPNRIQALPIERINNQGGQRSNDFNQPSENRNNHFNQSQHPNNQFNKEDQQPDEYFNQNNLQPQDQFNQNYQQQNDHYNQGMQPPNEHFYQGNQPVNNNFNQPYNDHFNQANQPTNDRFNQLGNDHYNKGNQQPKDRFYQGNQSANDHFNQQGNQWNQQRSNMSEKRVPPTRGPNNAGSSHMGQTNFGSSGQFNQGIRQSNKGRGHDNRQQNQQFGNFDQQNNFRGRGSRGYGGGPMRGRGRGYY